MRRSKLRLSAAVVAAALGVSLLPLGAVQAAPPPARDVSQFACPPEDVPESGFVDVSQDNTFFEEIECLVWYKITSGGPAGKAENEYGPELNVRRDQMASFVVRMIDYVDPGQLPAWDEDNDFTDVPDENPHVAAINRLHDAGVVQGAPEGKAEDEYGPDLPVRRGQMASFLNRAIGVMAGSPLTTTEDFFTDDEGSPHEDNINALASEGIVQGRADGDYHVVLEVRREAMAAFIMRTIDLTVENQDAVPPTPTELSGIFATDADADDELSPGDEIRLSFEGPMQLAMNNDDPPEPVVTLTIVDQDGDEVFFDSQEGADSVFGGADGISRATFEMEGTRTILITAGTVEERPGSEESDGILNGVLRVTSTRGITDTNERPWLPGPDATLVWPGPPPVGNQDYPGDPATSQSQPIGQSRDFTFSDMPSSTTFIAALVPCDEVTQATDGTITFGDNEGTPNAADNLGQTGAYIEAFADSDNRDYGKVSTSPLSRSVSITVNSDNAVCVRPVVFLDENEDGELNLDYYDQATEPFGIGGETTWVS